MRVGIVCPECGQRNGDHAPDCPRGNAALVHTLVECPECGRGMRARYAVGGMCWRCAERLLGVGRGA